MLSVSVLASSVGQYLAISSEIKNAQYITKAHGFRPFQARTWMKFFTNGLEKGHFSYASAYFRGRKHRPAKSVGFNLYDS
jgi:hypothetical protein